MYNSVRDDLSQAQIIENRKRLEQALHLHSQGFQLIPLGEDKRPICEWKIWQTEPITPELIETWWSTNNNIHFAILQGEISGTIAIDADDQVAIDIIASLCPYTPLTQITRRGKHFLFRTNPDFKIGNLRLKCCKGDIKGERGYVKMYPDAHWTKEQVLNAPIFDPKWLGLHTTTPEPEYIQNDSTHHSNEYAIEFAKNHLEKCPGSTQGKGKGADSYAFSLALYLVQDCGLSTEDAVELLYNWGQKDSNLDANESYYPWNMDQIEHKIKDAIRYMDPDKIGCAIRFEDALPNVDDIIKQVELPKVEPEIKEPKSKKERKEKRSLTVDEMLAQPDLKWQIENHFTENANICLYGDSGAYKSFLALDWAFCIATGKDFNGNKVKKGNSYYIVGEGRGGFKKRIQAWNAFYNLKPDDARFWQGTWNLSDKEQTKDLINVIKRDLGKCDFLVIDTLNKCMQGDENHPRDMGDYLWSIDALRDATEGTVCSNHHLGKDKSRGPRGHISLTNACDTMILSEKGLITCTKQKDFEEFETYNLTPSFILESFVLIPEPKWKKVLETMSLKHRDMVYSIFKEYKNQLFTYSDCLAMLKVAKTTFNRDMTYLKDLGFIVSQGNAYSLSQDVYNMILTNACVK